MLTQILLFGSIHLKCLYISTHMQKYGLNQEIFFFKDNVTKEQFSFRF